MAVLAFCVEQSAKDVSRPRLDLSLLASSLCACAKVYEMISLDKPYSGFWLACDL